MNKGIGNRPLLWPGVAAGAMLLAAVLPWPYGYYQLLRLVVCGVGAYFAYTAYQWGKLRAVWLFGGIAALFNPFVPIHLTRELWIPIDGVLSASVRDRNFRGWYFVGRQCDYLMETTHEEIKAIGFAGSAGSGAGAF